MEPYVKTLNGLLWSIAEINERILCGDIISEKAGLSRAAIICISYENVLKKQGCENVSVKAWIGFGGSISVTYDLLSASDLTGVRVAGTFHNPCRYKPDR